MQSNWGYAIWGKYFSLGVVVFTSLPLAAALSVIPDSIATAELYTWSGRRFLRGLAIYVPAFGIGLIAARIEFAFANNLSYTVVLLYGSVFLLGLLIVFLFGFVPLQQIESRRYPEQQRR